MHHPRPTTSTFTTTRISINNRRYETQTHICAQHHLHLPAGRLRACRRRTTAPDDGWRDIFTCIGATHSHSKNPNIHIVHAPLLYLCSKSRADNLINNCTARVGCAVFFSFHCSFFLCELEGTARCWLRPAVISNSNIGKHTLYRLPPRIFQASSPSQSRTHFALTANPLHTQIALRSRIGQLLCEIQRSWDLSGIY